MQSPFGYYARRRHKVNRGAMMTSGILLLILFAAPSAVFTDDPVLHKGENITSNEYCPLPKFTANGIYRIIKKARTSLDQKPYDIMTVICNPGYTLVGEETVTCLQGSWLDQMPECLPSCLIDEETSLVNFKRNARRCLLQPLVRAIKSIPREQSFISGCGIAVNRSTLLDPANIRDNEALIGELPWQVGIYRTATSYEQICGGSIVSKNVVISAAHCFWNDTIGLLPAAAFAVEAGKLNRLYNNKEDKHAQRSDVQEINIPPNFHGIANHFQSDIALVIVTRYFRFNEYVSPVCLDFNYKFDCMQLKPGKYGTIGGWGYTEEYKGPSPVLKIVNMPYINIEKCFEESPLGFKAYIAGDKFCAGYRNGTALCKGDSGGGLAFPITFNGRTQYYLRGIVSVSQNNKDAECDAWSWATYTHVYSHKKFIESVMQEICYSY